jgi:hypothetical protein
MSHAFRRPAAQILLRVNRAGRRKAGMAEKQYITPEQQQAIRAIPHFARGVYRDYIATSPSMCPMSVEG